MDTSSQKIGKNILKLKNIINQLDIMDSVDYFYRSLSKLWELVMDREACHDAVHGVAKSQTRLSDWTELNYRLLQPVTAAYTFFSSSYATLTKIDDILGRKPHLNKFTRLEIIQVCSQTATELKLEIHNWKITENPKIPLND